MYKQIKSVNDSFLQPALQSTHIDIFFPQNTVQLFSTLRSKTLLKNVYPHKNIQKYSKAVHTAYETSIKVILYSSVKISLYLLWWALGIT